MKAKNIKVPEDSGVVVDPPTEILAGGFEYKHPYTDGNSYFDATGDNIMRLIKTIENAKTQEEIAAAEELKAQFFERMRQNYQSIVDGIEQRIQDSIKR